MFQLALKLDDEHIKQKEWKQRVADNSDTKLPRYETTYNPNAFSVLAEQLLLENGVDIQYGVQVCDATVEHGKIKTLVTQGRSGRKAIAAKSVVDATGDAVVCQTAGAQTAVFEQKNILAAWYYMTEKDKFVLHPLGVCDVPEKHKSEEERAINQKRYVGFNKSNSSLCSDWKYSRLSGRCQ